MGAYLPGAGTLGLVVWCRARVPCSQGIPPEFYPPNMGMGPPIPHLCASSRLSTPLHTSPHLSASLPLLPICLDEYGFLNSFLSDFHTARFSDDSGLYLFCSLVVIFSVIVQGGDPCLPMPPSCQPEGLNTNFADGDSTGSSTNNASFYHKIFYYKIISM